jgi:hypothetical protein
MSTVLPDEPPDELLDELPLVLLVLLLLLLQPTAARATAAKTAIAEVRLIIFLSLILNCPAATEHSDRPVWASQQCDSRGLNTLPKSFAAAGHAFVPPVRSSTYSTVTTEFTGADGGGSWLPTAVVPRQARSDPAILAGESMPDSGIAEINRRVTKRSTAGCRGSTLAARLYAGFRQIPSMSPASACVRQ